MTYSTQLALKALEHKAIKLQPEDPFTWASGYRMPIYNNNRILLYHPDAWNIVIDNAFEAAQVPLHSILTYSQLIQTVEEQGYFNEQQLAVLREWKEDPFAWGENHGFQRVEK